MTIWTDINLCKNNNNTSAFKSVHDRVRAFRYLFGKICLTFVYIYWIISCQLALYDLCTLTADAWGNLDYVSKLKTTLKLESGLILELSNHDRIIYLHAENYFGETKLVTCNMK